MAPGYYVGGYASGHPVMLPMIDVVEVGAGGGSIAWLDDVGALKVGPQSAGADPGPICYRGGGTEPTITDANVVLGRLDPDNFLGGTMKLDAEARAAASRTRSRDPLKLDAVAAAQAIVDIAINKMSLAVREVSVAKGYDPRDFALVASGGAGPLHVGAIARELLHSDRDRAAVSRRISPRSACCWPTSAMISSARSIPISPASTSPRSSKSTTRWSRTPTRACATQRARSIRSISTCAMSARSSRCRCRSSWTSSSARDRAGIRTAFDELYEQRYAHHSPDEPVEMVNIRLGAIGKRPKLSFPSFASGERAQPSRRARGLFQLRPQAAARQVYRRETLGAGSEIAGPALIQEHGTTTVLFERDACTVAPSGELIIAVGAA